MASHSSSRSLNGDSATVPDTEITVIIPFNEYGDLDDLEFSNSSAFQNQHGHREYSAGGFNQPAGSL